ncbi:MAG TPA: hypothetical protein VF575_01100 [Candidatus Saccharimonadales bacterium]|jgi:hypothetical protein
MANSTQSNAVKVVLFGLLMIVAVPLFAIANNSSDVNPVNTKVNVQEVSAVQPVAPDLESATPEPVPDSVPTPPEAIDSEPVVTTPADAPDSDCDPNYTPCVPNVSYDLDCGDIGMSVSVIGSDTHRFDRDNDGYGCESY